MEHEEKKKTSECHECYKITRAAAAETELGELVGDEVTPDETAPAVFDRLTSVLASGEGVGIEAGGLMLPDEVMSELEVVVVVGLAPWTPPWLNQGYWDMACP